MKQKNLFGVFLVRKPHSNMSQSSKKLIILDTGLTGFCRICDVT